MKGFTVLELIAALALVALLTAFAIPSYQGYVERARVSQAVGELSELSLAIEKFRLNNDDRIPDDLAELGMAIPRDPWDRDYVYLNIQALETTATVRKDSGLNPLNADYDLYSLGKDGKSELPLFEEQARDDIVRANNGDYIGLAKDY